MLGLHGAAYCQYVAVTPRFVPRLSRYVESTSWTVTPRAWRRACGDAVSLMGGFAVARATDAGHAMGWLPVLLRMP